MSGVCEKRIIKEFEYLYPEPAQVPLGEKAKVWGFNPIKGIRQISPVPSA